MKTLYTSEEVAHILKVNKQVILRWLRDGKIQGYKMGKLWRVEDADLEAFLEQARQQATDQSHLVKAEEEEPVQKTPVSDQGEGEKKDYLTVKEAEELTGIKARTLQYRLKKGLIEGKQEGPVGKWIIPEEEVQKLLREE